MEQFIKDSAEKLLNFKKNVFTLKNAIDFLEKLALRGDIEKMQIELTKCLMSNSKNLDEKTKFIQEFIQEYQNMKTNNFKLGPISTEIKPNKTLGDPFEWKKTFKFKDKEEE